MSGNSAETAGVGVRPNTPLAGIRVLEFGGKGAAPYCAMLLADLGAEVVRVDRVTEAARADPNGPPRDRRRGRRSVAIDLKRPDGAAIIERVLPTFDVLVEGFRPGVMERLGLGPDRCHALNPGLVYARVTGWGQSGPYADRVGHDIDYIAVASLLAYVGIKGGRPLPPLNLAGDGAGGMLAAFGVASALVHAKSNGRGSVVDAAMLDAAASLMGTFYMRRPYGLWSEARGTNKVDGGAPFYDTYETADRRFIAVGAIEPHFYRALLEVLELDSAEMPDQWDESAWDELRRRFAEVVRTRTQAEWVAASGDRPACIAPVLGMDDAPTDPHNLSRGTFMTLDGIVQPAPAPRFSGAVPPIEHGFARDGQHSVAVLKDWGFDEEAIAQLRRDGVVEQL